MHLVVFENANWQSLAPHSFSRPTFSLMCGIGTLLEKQLRFLKPTRLTLWVRPDLAGHCRRHLIPNLSMPSLIETARVNEPLDGGPATLLDGSTLCVGSERSSARQIAEPGLVAVTAPGLCHDDVLHDSPRWKQISESLGVWPMGKAITHVWELLAFNEEVLVSDAAFYRETGSAPIDGPWHLINKDQIFVRDGVKLGPGCVLDASKGPVMLDDGAIVGASSVVQGPCYIGAKSEISPLSLIRPGTSIGPSCKIGGEVARAIVIGYSNKAHEGYLGDSYLGEWVNLGAGTITSNLKTTYGSITMPFGGGEIDTGRQFLGSLIGDHAKTAIGTRFMSGSYMGFGSMISMSTHAPRFTPSFKFCTDRGTAAYRLEKAFEVGRAMFGRRGRVWSTEDESLMRYAQKVATSAERQPTVAG